jgi:hypothetical protein
VNHIVPARSGATVRAVLSVGALSLLAPALLLVTPPASADTSTCNLPANGGPLLVDARCEDPQYNRPVIDSESDLTAPVQSHKVNGHFEGTTAKFTIYLPPKRQWAGRFFQSVYPLQGEIARDDPEGNPDNTTAGSIAADTASGAYTVQTNGTGGYRIDAAAAKFSKTVAARYYKTDRRIYGYVWGGSGGSFLAISGLENTQGVWDGGVPYVVGTPTSIPNNFFIRAFARFVLVDQARAIADAVAPGGSGRPKATLTPLQREVFDEVSKVGVPVRAWEDYRYVLGLDDATGLLGFLPTVRQIDSSYADDFWTKPGYLGTAPTPLGDFFRASLVDHTSTITSVRSDATGNPSSLVLDTAPTIPANTGPTWLDFSLVAPDGTTQLGALQGSLDAATRTLTLADSVPADVRAAIVAGGGLRIDNRWYLAALTYHRHQVPTDNDYAGWQQFVDKDGKPVYPQRPVNVGQLISNSITGGGSFTGRVNAKTIVVDNLIDADAFPWQADWYAKRVKDTLGSDTNRLFRVYDNDNADHHIGPARTSRLVSYDGMLQQALRDLSAWAEDGVKPPRSTRYRVSDSQVELPPTAGERRGLQPVVRLKVNGRDRADVRVNHPVLLVARVQAPPRAGRVVGLEWDLTGTGDFTPGRVAAGRELVIRRTQTFSARGTYWVTLRATTQRHEGERTARFARVQNLDRVRVVVR